MVALDVNAPLWMKRFNNALRVELERIKSPTDPLKPPRKAAADFPPASEHTGGIIYNTDINRCCESDGTNWRRMDTGATI